ncbi:MAG: hypothetical protein KF764_16925 [Labilithrix sp.]|nr:hypothetical protein [Labilithrix sp.]
MTSSTEESVRRSARVLAAFMSQAEAQGFAGGFTLAPNAFLGEWATRSAARAKLTPGYSAPRVEPMPPSTIEHTVNLSAHPLFQQIYPNAEFAMVELGKLIAFQHWMDTDVSDGVHAAGAQGRPDDAEVLAKCLPLDIIPPSLMRWQHSGPGQIMICSLNNTLGFHGPQYNPATGEIRFGVAAGANLMLVREHAGRYILANGYHRAWWLRSRGVEMVPVVLKRVQRHEVTSPGMVSIDQIFSDRPPLVDDFLDETISCSVDVRSMVRVVKISAEVLVVPRLL